MATTGCHVFECGLYLSALLSSVVSSLPPTAYIMLLYTATPKCLRLVPMGATGVQRFVLGSYLSTVNKYSRLYM